ncbi:class I adenylate-forming enzyme family protein [Gordonia hydrophobica]|uniref:Class I adenylate-forming enzyme family protein n=1 Tax=Gordonia hydrophobica TaxID=40516 RepID=A0ABZ2TZM1_9ACTN|nr:class I adenylate-forming enzyme family protein [Gordonia hydrophobica]
MLNTLWPWLLDEPTISANLEARARRSPDELGLADEHGNSLTWAQFDASVDRVVAGLAAQGIGQGSRVCWQLPMRISTVLVMFALRRLGALQAPIIPIGRKREVSAAVRAVNAEFLLVPGTWNGFDYVELAGDLDLGDLAAPTIMEIGSTAPDADPDPGLRAPQDPDEVAWVYFTSGSTGLPKGARHTDGTLLTTGRAFAGTGHIGENGDDVVAMAFPIAHVGGIEFLIAAICSGTPMVISEAFVPQAAVELYSRMGVTLTGGAPPFYQAFAALAEAAAPAPLLPSLRTFKGGGAPCPPELYYKVRDAMGVTVAHDYGMTEVPMVAVADPRDEPEVLAKTDGHPIEGNTVRLVDADGQEVTPGEVGEVQISGSGVCRGYTDPVETEKAFTDDGWFRTGDLGRIHPGGQIELVGRLKDVIIRKGENISPQEIEELLIAHPAIAEVAVIGVPDADRGEMVCAVVTPAPDVDPPDLAAIVDFLSRAQVMKQKLPERLELVESLPRTGLAKIARNELRTRYGTPIG